MTIAKNHLFSAIKAKTGVHFAKRFARSTYTAEFDMFKQPNRNAAFAGQPEGIQSDIFYMKRIPLEETTSEQLSNRKNYLQVNVLQSYYPHNSNFGASYFRDGTEKIVQ